MLEINGVDFSYGNGKDLVLKNVDVELDMGRTLGIIGPNGSGKSTLLKCINRILRPQSGRIALDGKDMKDLAMLDIAKRIGYVPQGNGKMFPSTVFDTILLGRIPHIKWRPRNRDLEVVTDVIRTLGLDRLALREMNELSGGQKQKVIIGRALAQEPKLLLLDEPTANLDLKHQLEVLSMIKKQTEKGLSVVMAIHDLTLAGRFCDEFVMLRDGKVFAVGGPEVLTSENIQAVYDVKVTVIRRSGKVLVVPEGILEQ